MRILFLYILMVVVTCSVRAQVRTEPYDSRLCFDVNLEGGLQSQHVSAINYLSSFTDPLNPNISSPKYSKGTSMGFDVEGGYFFDKDRHWGVGTGLLYIAQQGSMTMNTYHIEYQGVDFNKDVYRQLVTATQPIKEKITSTNTNIPLVLKYKRNLDYRIWLAVDAGIVYNTQMKNRYSTNASFNYEAIYQVVNGVAVYDNSPTPSVSQDWMLTQAEFDKTDPKNVAALFNSYRAQGFNVGLGVQPSSKKGMVAYQGGSIGGILKPAISYELSYKVYLDMGLYYIYQGFHNNATTNYRMTDKLGAYSSMLNSITTAQQNSYGLNVGLRVFIRTN